MSAHKDKKEQDMKRSRLDDITRKESRGVFGHAEGTGIHTQHFLFVSQ